MKIRSSSIVLLAGAVAMLLLNSCESTKPRGPQPKSSYMPWDRPKAGQGAGALGSMIQRQE